MRSTRKRISLKANIMIIICCWIWVLASKTLATYKSHVFLWLFQISAIAGWFEMIILGPVNYQSENKSKWNRLNFTQWDETWDFLHNLLINKSIYKSSKDLMLCDSNCKETYQKTNKTYLVRLYCTIVQHSKDHLKKANMQGKKKTVEFYLYINENAAVWLAELSCCDLISQTKW